MRRASILPIAVMAFAIVAFLFVVIYAVTPGLKYPWSTNTTVTKSATNTSTNVNTVANTNSVVEPTADWKTYTNVTYSYSISYPATWSVSETLAPKIIQIIPPDAAGKTSIEMGPVLFITAGVPDIDSEYSNRHTVTINGTEAIRTLGGAMYEQDSTFFPQMSGYISLGWPTHFVKDYPDYEKILSSFTMVAPTADWKTYTNASIGYSLQYPADWTTKTINDPYFNGKAILSTLQNPGFQEPYGAIGGIFINVYANRNISDALNDWFTKNREITAEKKIDRVNSPCAGTAQVSDMITEVSYDTVAEFPAIVQYEKDLQPTYCEGGATTTKSYFVKKGSTIFEILASSPTSNEATDLLEEFDQVMDTFTFIQ